MLKAPKQEGSFEPVKAGSYAARCYSIVVVGTVQPNNPAYSPSSKIRIGWELPTEMRESADGEVPHTVTREYGFTMGKRGKLRPMIEGWFGRSFPSDDAAYDFDLEKLIGKTCMVAVVNETSDDKVYANISSVSPVPKGLEVPGEVNAPFFLSYENWDQNAFEALPQFLKDKMAGTPEYKTLVLQGKAKAVEASDTASAPAEDKDVTSADVNDAMEKASPVKPSEAEIEEDECPF